MNKRFIILIDFSEYSANLLKYAYSWSMAVGAELLLVHQTVVIAPEEQRTYVAQYAKEAALEELEKLVRSALPLSARVSYVVSEQPLTDTLRSLLSSADYENLVFIGIKGTGLLKKIFIGSVAIDVIEKAGNTVVAMPKEVSQYEAKKLFVGVSDKHPLNISALNQFFDLAGNSIEKVTFFYLAKPNEKPETIEKQFSELKTLYAGKFDTAFEIYEGENNFERIKNMAGNKTGELLIVQKGSHLLTDQPFRRFLINELVYEGQTPLVVLP